MNPSVKQSVVKFFEGAKKNLKRDKYLAPMLMILREGKIYDVPIYEHLQTIERRNIFGNFLMATLIDEQIEAYFIIMAMSKTKYKKTQAGFERKKAIDVIRVIGESRAEQFQVESEYIEAGGEYVFKFPDILENYDTNNIIGGEFSNLLFKQVKSEKTNSNENK